MIIAVGKLIDGEVRSIRALAKEEGITNRYVRKLLPLAFLAPDIVERIMAGLQPRDLSLEALVHMLIPAEWNSQRRVLGML